MTQAPSTPHAGLTLYRFALSGHSHRVELMLSLLGLDYRGVDVDLAKGEHKQPWFLALNTFGQVPVLTDGETVIADSNAILVYLCRRYGGDRFMGQGPVGEAQVQRWLSVAAGQLAFGPSLARVAVLFGRGPDLAQRGQAVAAGLLPVMAATLTASPYLAGDTPTVADIANYSYTVLAPEGGIDLAPFPAVRDWLARIEALPGFLAVPFSPIGLRASA